MTFPATPLDVRVDLHIGSTWVDVTSDTRTENGITITRGRADEASRPDPSTCSLTLANTDGKYSPRNPTSPYFGLLGRNTPIRVGIGTPPAAAVSTSAVSSTSLVAPGVTAEEDGLMFCFWAATPAGNIAGPGGFTMASERDGTFATFGTGVKSIAAGVHGTQTATHSLAATRQAAVTIAVPGPSAYWAGGYTGTIGLSGALVSVGVSASPGEYILAVQGYSSDPNDEMVRAPAQSQAQSPNWVLLADTGVSTGPRMKVWYRRVETSGAFDVHFVGAFGVDNYAHAWVVADPSDYFCRFTGEVSTWPPKWDASGTDVQVPIVASGVKRRLGQGAAVLQSAMRRELVTVSDIAAYWPMEDPAGAARFGSAIGGTAMEFLGTPSLASNSEFLCSDALPTFSAAGGRGAAPYDALSSQFSAGSLVYLPAGLIDDATLFTITTNGGTIATWTVSYDTSVPGFRLQAFDTAGVSKVNVNIGPWTTPPTNVTAFLYLAAIDSGANVNWTLAWVPILGDGASPIRQSSSGTIVGGLTGSVTGFQVGGGPVTIDQDVAFGHAVVGRTTTALFRSDVWSALIGHAGESPQLRMVRLAAEENVAFAYQAYAPQPAMGVQLPAKLLELLEQAEDTDGGTLTEPRGFIGFQYRPRSSRYNQDASLSLGYVIEGHIEPPLEPVDDDQSTRNDVTVTRIGGGFSRSALTSGSLSTQPPPLGVGRYDTNYDLSLQSDADTVDQAAWRLHVGTWDETRWPQVRTNLAAAPGLINDVQALDVGDKVTLQYLPTWVAGPTVDLILEGYAETLFPFSWEWVGNYSPAGPFRVGLTDSSDYGRADSLYSTLSAGITTTATALSVAVASGSTLWITTATYPADFPFTAAIGGEEVTVTAITGTTSPQTWTVVRSVNGIVKVHPIGAQIRLARPVAVAL